MDENTLSQYHQDILDCLPATTAELRNTFDKTQSSMHRTMTGLEERGYVKKLKTMGDGTLWKPSHGKKEVCCDEHLAWNKFVEKVEEYAEDYHNEEGEKAFDMLWEFHSEAMEKAFYYQLVNAMRGFIKGKSWKSNNEAA